jgi:signal transduction histidine kinase
MRRSFAFKLAAAFAGIGIAAAAITALLVNLAFGAKFNSYIQQQQQARRTQLVQTLSQSYSRNGGWNKTDLAAIAPVVTMDGGSLVLQGPSGNTIWSTSSDVGANAMMQMHRGMMGSSSLGPVQDLAVYANGQKVGTAVVQFPNAGVLPQDRSFRDSVNRIFLFGGLVAGLGALAMGGLLARRATSPARELTAAAREYAAGDHTRRVKVETSDELGEMGAAFNRMAATIDEEDRLRKAFATDVAHELRTPLAILRTQIEAMQDGVRPQGPESLASLHEETLRLGRLVDDLQTLSAADAAGFALQLQETDLAPLVRMTAEEFSTPYEEKGVELHEELEDVAVTADPTRVRQIVANLLSNALKFTPEGGRVRVALQGSDDGAVIAVSDSGRGISPDEIGHVFDRFYRGKDVRAGGSGVGLTVVRELVQAHGGTVQAESAGVDRGSTFTVLLPSSELRERFTTPSHRLVSVEADRKELS